MPQSIATHILEIGIGFGVIPEHVRFGLARVTMSEAVSVLGGFAGRLSLVVRHVPAQPARHPSDRLADPGYLEVVAQHGCCLTIGACVQPEPHRQRPDLRHSSVLISGTLKGFLTHAEPGLLSWAEPTERHRMCSPAQRSFEGCPFLRWHYLLGFVELEQCWVGILSRQCICPALAVLLPCVRLLTLGQAKLVRESK